VVIAGSDCPERLVVVAALSDVIVSKSGDAAWRRREGLHPQADIDRTSSNRVRETFHPCPTE
jgi:hypothetical protein